MHRCQQLNLVRFIVNTQLHLLSYQSKHIITTKKSNTNKQVKQQISIKPNHHQKIMWTDSPSQLIKNKKTQRPKTYYQLIQRVGIDGQYQFRAFLIFILIWFYTGIILMNTSFLFYNKDFDCQLHGLVVEDCERMVCELSQGERKEFINKEDNYFNSIAIELGQFHCDEELYINLAKCSVYMGSLVGFLVFSYVTDNYGRKLSLLISITICVLGNILVSSSFNITLASIGLFLSGGGANASANTSLCFLNQLTNNYKRQKYSILIQFSFTIGAILVTGFYYIIPHWRVISVFLITIPSLISLFMVFFYLQQTPQFLCRKPNSVAIAAINYIGKVNYKIMDVIEEEDLLSVKQKQTAIKQFNQLKLKHIDLFRCISLRSTTLFASFICFTIYSMYYGSMMIMYDLGFDIYSTNFIIQLAELVVYLPVYAYIIEIRRKLLGVGCFMILVGLSVVLIVVEIPKNCEMCVESIVYLVFTFLFRSVVAVYFCVFELYINELYPTRVTGLGVGTVSAFGSLASILSPFILSLINANFVMMIFCGFALIGAAVSLRLKETKGLHMRIEVEEIQVLKEKEKQKSAMIGRSSFAKLSLIKSVLKDQSIQ